MAKYPDQIVFGKKGKMSTKVRLLPEEMKTIVEEARAVFGREARIFLFGSRTDLQAKGGDIDLLVRIPKAPEDWPMRKWTLIGRLQERLGDQKIDLIVWDGQNIKNPITLRLLQNIQAQLVELEV